MRIVDDFLLMSGADIPLVSSNIIIHNPSLQELVDIFLYENDFLTGFEFLFFSKDRLGEEEQKMLFNFSDYEILLMLLKQENVSQEIKGHLRNLKQLLFLLLKNYDVEFKDEYIVLTQDEHVLYLDEENFDLLKSVALQIFPLKDKTKQAEDFNPQSQRAKEIAEKIKKGRKKVAKQKEASGTEESIFEKYVSILSIGLQIPINTLYQCTVYQLFNMFNRFEKKEVYDVYLKAQLAGASDMKEVDHWMM